MKVIARSSNLLGKITILVMVFLCVNTALALDGSGTQENPWRIKSLDDFNDFAADANYWAGFTRLETDVNLAGRVYERAVIAWDVNDSEDYFQGAAYTGVFDGNDHKIANLTIDDGGAGHWFLSLFGCIGEDSEVRNLGLEEVSVSGSCPVSGLVGENLGSISNCYSNGDVNGLVVVGGLVGVNQGDCISNCYSTASVSGEHTVGGLVGVNLGTISNCYSTGDVNGIEGVGGLLGVANGNSLSNCYSTSNVSGVENVGGLVGVNVSSISNCYSTGDVNGDWPVGGLVGLNTWLRQVLNCFWDKDTQTHGVTYGIGYNDGGIVTNVSGLPTAQMQTRSTYTDAGWDFINVWNIGENQTYPYLRAYLLSDINKDGIVNFLDVAITSNQWMEGVE